MSLILSILVAASASTASKDYLTSEPMLAGSKIKYCEHETPTACKTIDRSKEPITTDLAIVSSKLTLELSKIAPEFHSISVDFVKSDKMPGSFDLKINLTQDPAKQPSKK